MTGWLRFWDYARKAGVSFLFVAGAALSAGLLPNPWDKVISAILAVAAYFGVYVTPNDTKAVRLAALVARKNRVRGPL